VMQRDKLRIAWLFPSLQGASYWHPVLSEFTKIFSQTVVYTGQWPGFTSGFENSFQVEVVGNVKFIKVADSKSYVPNFTYASPKIIIYLLQFKPDVIFTSSFSIWTLLALLLKFLGQWKVVITYDGSSPTYDYRNSPFRLFFRRFMARFADAFITNSQAGKAYLTEVLGATEKQVFTQPYEVPDPAAMKVCISTDRNILKYQKPIFLSIGQIIYRKGLHYLLEACALLKTKGITNYTLLIMGTGPQQQEFQELSQNNGLEACIQWIGSVNYEYLSTYFSNADVFVFPTLEDTWGMVVLEAMAFSKPVLCSKWAGTAEMIVEDENGYIFDPYQPEILANLMQRFIEDPDLSYRMGEKSRQIIAPHTPTAVTEFLTEVIRSICPSDEFISP
jgi:glycosyltransferase involved in cell wall biosynthesis